MKDELQNIIDSGILSASEIDFLITMNKKAKVLKIHKSKISKGGGKDTRWFTRVDGRKIAAKTEEELIDKLYEIYFGKKNSLCVSRSLGEGPDHKYHVEEYLKKNSKPRTITIPDAAFEIVDMVSRIHCSLNERDTQNDLFKVMYPGNIDRKLYRICDDLGIVRRSLNKLRKTHISMLINSGFDIDFVRRQAGHTNINTTLNNYTYQTRKDAEMVRKMNRELEQFGTPALEKEKDPEKA